MSEELQMSPEEVEHTKHLRRAWAEYSELRAERDELLRAWLELKAAVT